MEKECLICGQEEHSYVTPNKIVIPICDACRHELKNAQAVVYKKCSIEIAHQIIGHSKCGNLHGHTVTVIVGVRGTIDIDTGMVIDFHTLKHYLKKEITDKFDHKYVNEILPIPTAEFMAFYIFKKLEYRGLDVVSVKVKETKNNYVEYRGEENV